MNTIESDTLLAIADHAYTNQRELAAHCGYSLGIVNRSLKKLIAEGYLDSQYAMTEQARRLLQENRPRRAVILAAGAGMRMEPFNTKVPKGLLSIHGERIIERQIRYLQEVGIREIYVVAGFRKERFEYLMDTFGVELIVNSAYAIKNNLHSVAMAQAYLDCAYVIPCDLWLSSNPFRKNELYSWYMVSDAKSPESDIRMNRKSELVPVSGSTPGDAMVGISYLTPEDAAAVRQKILQMDTVKRYDGAFWEEALYDSDRRMVVRARRFPASQVAEINTCQQLMELDCEYFQQGSPVSEIITAVLHTDPSQISQITPLKIGMTNHTFSFCCNGKKYILRIPFEKRHELISRRNEAEVYETIRGKGFCEEIYYLNPGDGKKISAYLDDSRVCDQQNPEDVRRCMDKLKQLHGSHLKVDFSFDIFERIRLLESLWEGIPSDYADYEKTRENVFSLRDFISRHIDQWTLCHIDPVPDNFLFCRNAAGGEDLYLIDWEYAAMQDPHVDIAMFGIYAQYDREHMEQLIDAYFPEGCPSVTRAKIYCYIASCGLLWSNWCERAGNMGVEFGAYALKQYRYAKDYYRLAAEMIEKFRLE